MRDGWQVKDAQQCRSLPADEHAIEFLRYLILAGYLPKWSATEARQIIQKLRAGHQTNGSAEIDERTGAAFERPGGIGMAEANGRDGVAPGEKVAMPSEREPQLTTKPEQGAAPAGPEPTVKEFGDWLVKNDLQLDREEENIAWAAWKEAFKLGAARSASSPAGPRLECSDGAGCDVGIEGANRAVGVFAELWGNALFDCGPQDYEFMRDEILKRLDKLVAAPGREEGK